ncbi:hypothetical protein GCM10007933_24140 [Zoogloea oryzae]|uniref:DUF4391 domain-containing protein n=1 Tax=Zoogloea oryzae TaxID=310767 RepID=A0ABQ6FBI4_9RHOO|nr:DUF4391 domain-containing protein [Zoogloea oryzae]GLT22953.1 hypothetical protein GCM10007933_24140 [Zoogloea oryzae]
MNIAPLTANELLAALALPSSALVQQRIPKKMLAENGAATSADRKLVQDGIDELAWHAALKPSNVGIPAYEDELRSYLEVTVLVARLRTEVVATDQHRSPQAPAAVSTNVRRVAELIHRAVPYPTVLLLEHGHQLVASVVHVRWAQREAGKTVLDGDSISVPIKPGPECRAFLEAMALGRQPRFHLKALYQGWFDTLSAWQAVEQTGQFRTSESPARAAERRAALRACTELDVRIATARNAAAKEKQIARQVAVNLEIKALLAERQRVAQDL